MTTPRQRIREAYGFDFPDDFFAFAEFERSLPRGLLEGVCDMRLAAPFAILRGEKLSEHPDNPHWETRYYHDLPEFITLFLGGSDGLHWGYFFDAPGDRLPIVTHYWHSDTFEHALDGDSVFEAVRQHIEYCEEECQEEIEAESEVEENQHRLEEGQRLRELLTAVWGADRPEIGQDYLDEYDGASERETVAGTWSQLGIVVPETWYRPLSENPWARPPVVLTPDVVEPLLDEAEAALREGCPGTALQLGHNLWLWADEYPRCYGLLERAYIRLDRLPLIRLLHSARAHRAWCDRPRS